MNQGLACTQDLLLFPLKTSSFCSLRLNPTLFPNTCIMVITFAVSLLRHDVHFNYTPFYLYTTYNYIFFITLITCFSYLQAFHKILNWTFSHLVSDMELAKENSCCEIPWAPCTKTSGNINNFNSQITNLVKKGRMPTARGNFSLYDSFSQNTNQTQN